MKEDKTLYVGSTHTKEYKQLIGKTIVSSELVEYKCKYKNTDRKALFIIFNDDTRIAIDPHNVDGNLRFEDMKELIYYSSDEKIRQFQEEESKRIHKMRCERMSRYRLWKKLNKEFKDHPLTDKQLLDYFDKSTKVITSYHDGLTLSEIEEELRGYHID